MKWCSRLCFHGLVRHAEIRFILFTSFALPQTNVGSNVGCKKGSLMKCKRSVYGVPGYLWGGYICEAEAIARPHDFGLQPQYSGTSQRQLDIGFYSKITKSTAYKGLHTSLLYMVSKLFNA